MSDERLARVEQACIELAAAGDEITFDAVAARAGIGRATLYRRPELHAIVSEHRRHGEEALTLTGLAVQLDQLRQALEAVAARVRHHEELLRKLSRRPAIKRTR
jgi:AcrR family transcriptional regulator